MTRDRVSATPYCLLVLRIAITLCLVCLSISPAFAGTPGVSPTVDPGNGFPIWYQDANGLRVEPCLYSGGVNDPNCVLLADPGFNPNQALTFPTNFPGEFFYDVIDSDQLVTPGCSASGIAAGKAKYRAAVEGSFLNGVVVPGEQITFARTKIVANGLCPNTRYLFTHPYGVDAVTTDANGAVVANKKGATIDIGCGGLPCNFSIALTSRVFGGFVKWDPNVLPAAPAGYLGDAATLHTIVGSPNGTNLFSLADSGGAVLVQTALFTVSGRLAGPLIASPSSVDFGGVNLNSSSAASTIVFTNLNLADLTIAPVAIAGADAADYAITADTCSAQVVKQDQSCSVSVVFTPTQAVRRNASLQISHNSARSPLVVSLTGTGVAGGIPTAVPSVTSLDFGSIRVRQTSSVQTVTLNNGGSAPLGVTTAITGGDASQFVVFTDTCTGRFIDPGANCQVSLRFAPMLPGALAASLQFTDNATDSPQSVALTGTGTGGVAAVSSSNFFADGVDTNFPLWYQDENAVQLEPCMYNSLGIPDPNCVVLAGTGFDPNLPLNYVGNFPGEFFYFVADSNTINTPGCPASGIAAGKAKYRAAMEGSFTNGFAEIGQELMFGRTKIVASGLCPNTAYAFTHPYGTDFITTDSAGAVVANKKGGTIDVGCAGAPCNRTDPLASRVFGGFIKWDPAVAPAAPIGYLGDSTTLHSITGSPFIPAGGTGPANFFRVADLNGAVIAETDQFTVAGKLAGPISANPNGLAFGDQAISTTSAAQAITISNIGAASVTVNTVSIAGADAAHYAIVAGTDLCSAQQLAAGASCTVSIAFTPTAAGTMSAAVNIDHTGANNPVNVSLIGTGVGVPAASLSASSLTFAGQQVGTRSVSQRVTITNNGTGNLVIGGAGIVGANLGDFTVTGNGCVAALAPAATCNIDVAFAPTARGSRTASLSIADNAADSPQSVTLTGAGTAAVASISPASLSFASQLVNTTSAAQNLTITNNGDINLSVTGATISGANAADFSVVLNTCTTVAVAPGGNCLIGVTFKPGAAGNRSASLSIADNALDTPQAVSLSGTGAGAAATVSPTSITFTDRTVGTQSAAQIVTITNSGSATLTVNTATLSNTADFVITANNCGNVAVGLSCSVSVAFKPSAGGLRSGTLNINDNAPNTPQQVALSGNGLAAGPIVTLSPTSVTFANQQVGTTSASQAVIVSNTGTANLTVTGVTLGGTNPGDFSIVSNGCATVLAGASCTINVAFKPTVASLRTASLAVADNATGSPQSVPLSGTGTSTAVPVATVTPASLDFGNQQTLTTSAAKTVTVSNTGTLNLVITTVTVNAIDYAATGCVGATVAPRKSCTISVTFKPSAGGARPATLTINDNAGTQQVTLTGTGVVPVNEILNVSAATATLSKGAKQASWSVTGTTNVTAGNSVTVKLTRTGQIIGTAVVNTKGAWSVSANKSTIIPLAGDTVTATSAFQTSSIKAVLIN